MEIDFAKLDRAFNPRCVAVVGDKGRLQWIHSDLNFRGKLYSVQVSPQSIKAIEALGVKNYTSLLDIPEPIDLAVVAVPRAVAPRILEDCITKGVNAAHFFTAGFSETATEEGIQLERQLTARAREADFYLIGPNCMGIFNPNAGIRQMPLQYLDSSGPVGFISQSGTHATAFSLEAHLQGVDISKSVSFGNGVVLDSPDYLEYFGQDDAIKIIGMYIEGVKDGRRFLSVLRKVAALKPVVIWKGGRTEDGCRATASHTASLAIAQKVWESAVRQCGAISVGGLEEMIDTIKALIYLTPVRSNRVAVFGGSGGQSVSVSDAFAERGLTLPPLTQQSYDRFASFFSLVGASYRNPVDTGAVNRSEMRRILEVLVEDDNIDSLAMLMIPARIVGRSSKEINADISLMIETRQRTSKPLFLILPYHPLTGWDVRETSKITQKLAEGGVPTFLTVDRAAEALRNALEYYRFRNGDPYQEERSQQCSLESVTSA